MRPTLFYIPHEFLGIPVLGFGWVFGLLAVAAVGFALIAIKNKSLGKLLEDQGIIFVVAACIIVFLLPQIETRIQDGKGNEWNAGLPIRGYGVLLMMGVVSAIGIALYRCRKVGISQDAFFSLATWVVVAGLLGARLFYVIQKWNELAGDTLVAKIWTALKVTEGGLVVYGSVIGGLIAIVLWSFKNQQKLMPIADCVTPAFFIGLAFGRVGCLLNGCCYGGICESTLPSIEFPSGSPAYMDQLFSGRLLGIITDSQSSTPVSQRIAKVLPKSWASEHGIQAGEDLIAVQETQIGGATQDAPMSPPVFEVSVRTDQHRMIVSSAEVPPRSIPVHPSQIYAAISGILLCGWTLLLAENTKKAGIVFGAGLVAYGVLRIIEEIIRVDEAGQFGTSFSIAQWISAAGILIGMAVVFSASMGKNR